MLLFDHYISKTYQKVPSCINVRVWPKGFCQPLRPLCTVVLILVYWKDLSGNLDFVGCGVETLSHHFIDGDIASLFFDLFAFFPIYYWCQGVWFFSWSEWWAYGFAMRRWNAKAHYFDRLKNQLRDHRLELM